MLKRYSLIFACVLFSVVSFAQNLLWDVDFRFQFDNREYNSSYSVSKTLFGAKLAPEIGIGWNDSKHGMNALMIGGNLTADFGAKTFTTKPEITLYYAYLSSRFKAYAGILPYRKLIGDYSNAFFSDSIRFYDSNMEGLLLQYKNKWGYVEFGCDWNSMYSKENREKFRLFSGGDIRFSWFMMGYGFSMYHFAGSYDVKGVVDNVLASPYVGFDVSHLVPMDTLYLKLAYLQSYQWDRRHGKQIYPKGGQIDFRIEKWGVGIYDAFYFGQNLMPYYEKYGMGLYWSEDYYRTEHKCYNRLEVYWHPVRRRDLDLKIRSVHHFDGVKWGWQQLVSLGVNLNNDFIHSVKTKSWKSKREANNGNDSVQ